MQQEQEFYETANVIVSFTYSYTQNQQRKEKEQPESEPTPSLTDIISSLQSLLRQILKNRTCKQVIQIPKLLRSLIELSRFKVGNHIGQKIDKQRIEVRKSSRLCLWNIQFSGDEQDQSELVNVGFGRVMSISYSTAGGVGEERYQEICNGLHNISWFLRELHEGRNDYPSFQPLPLLVRRTEEQIEEEGANEEIEAQMKNNAYQGRIKYWANKAKAATLNRFIHSN
ncbi:MAG: hypothetical protein EZS28_044176 [Streblomastix strix]|uniref:Uncharacterized protein n=1 Tax=Streblomastix strix TaxID=222440 RepID=A0A5J4TQ17_9EUKA|nr:MAG: hypothetical protein EZS28_044176 [Streblomastix strix]